MTQARERPRLTHEINYQGVLATLNYARNSTYLTFAVPDLGIGVLCTPASCTPDTVSVSPVVPIVTLPPGGAFVPIVTLPPGTVVITCKSPDGKCGSSSAPTARISPGSGVPLGPGGGTRDQTEDRLRGVSEGQ